MTDRQQAADKLRVSRHDVNVIRSGIAHTAKTLREGLSLLTSQMDPRAANAIALSEEMSAVLRKLEEEMGHLIVQVALYQDCLQGYLGAIQEMKRVQREALSIEEANYNREKQRNWELSLRPGDTVAVHWTRDGERLQALARFERLGRGSVHVRLEHGVLTTNLRVSFNPGTKIIVPACGAMLWSAHNGVFDARTLG